MNIENMAGGVSPRGLTFGVIIPIVLKTPLPSRLSPLEALEEAQIITPDCIPVGSNRYGAKLFKKFIKSGGVLLRWPDGVTVALFASRIPPDDGLFMYLFGREVLEEHLTNHGRGA